MLCHHISAIRLVSKMLHSKTILIMIMNQLELTCLQWFLNTMRQVSGSAVQGLEGAVRRPERLPGPLGFSLLSQLILTQ